MFRGPLDTEGTILGSVSGKIRRSFLRILLGNRVKIEISHSDSSSRHTIYRLRNRDSKDKLVEHSLRENIIHDAQNCKKLIFFQ
uniref:InfA n=1 Tax=Scleromitrion brachypodum TaxID=3054898 RepID=A0A899L5T0_9GENT|nr:InfA [Scleromitrion brachypodum]QSM34996.1 InfA [Scleromitrion brachypodum]